MAKQQGKVKAIPVKKVTEGMQVTWKSIVRQCIGRVKSTTNTTSWIELDNKKDNVVAIENWALQTLIVEYETMSFEEWMKKNPYKTTRSFTEEEWESDQYDHWKENHIKQLPLKYSQWQSANDNGEMDSGKIIEFELTNTYRNPLMLGNHKILARIIPKKKTWEIARKDIELCLGTYTNSMIENQTQWIIDMLDQKYPMK